MTLARDQLITPLESSNRNEVFRLQTFTILWMACELAFSLYAGIRAHSVALVAFVTDSGIELLSALVVLRRFNIGATEKMAARINAALLYLLGIYILVCSAASVL